MFMAGIKTSHWPRARSQSVLPLLLALLFAPGAPQAAELELYPADVDPSTRVELLGGPSGHLWNLGRLDPYELDGYGRGGVHLEAALMRPLRPLGEAWDIVSLPTLMLETNFGYLEQPGGDSTFAGRLRRWQLGLTFFDFFSLRYGRDRHDARIVDSRRALAQPGQDPDDFIHRYDLSIRTLKLGLAGRPERGELSGLLEVGFFRAWQEWPIIQVNRAQDPESLEGIWIVQRWMLGEGLYGILRINPVPDVWPIETRLETTLGSITTARIVLALEPLTLPGRLPPGQAPVALGVRFEGRWRFWQNGFDQADNEIDMPVQPRDTLLRATLYIRWRGSWGGGSEQDG
jgi:hypothetical protein